VRTYSAFIHFLIPTFKLELPAASLRETRICRIVVLHNLMSKFDGIFLYASTHWGAHIYAAACGVTRVLIMKFAFALVCVAGRAQASLHAVRPPRMATLIAPVT
jgi:hypothetical protein